MKRILSLSAIVASSLYASTITIHPSWNLVGAVEGLNPSNIPCAQTVWAYDTNGWKLYQTQDDTQNYGYPSLDIINKGEGFWVYSNCDRDSFLEFSSFENPISDLNITTTPTDTLLLTNLTTGYQFNNTDNQWFSTIVKSGTNITITDYDYENGWSSDTSFTGALSQNSDTNSTVTFGNGMIVDFVIEKTEKIDTLNGVSYTDLYLSDTQIVVKVPGDGWTDVWDWTPRYWDEANHQEIAVTTNEQLKTMFLTNNKWIGENHSMFVGAVGDTSGDMVQGRVTGTFACDNDGDGIDNNICENIERTPVVIGSWSYDSSTGLRADLPNETQTLSIVSSSDSSTGYAVQSVGNDKVGAIWKEHILTGTDASLDLIKGILAH